VGSLLGDDVLRLQRDTYPASPFLCGLLSPHVLVPFIPNTSILAPSSVGDALSTSAGLPQPVRHYLAAPPTTRPHRRAGILPLDVLSTRGTTGNPNLNLNLKPQTLVASK
jgi:hypothetical protein